MTHLQSIRLRKPLIVLGLASVLSACNGDTNPRPHAELVSMDEPNVPALSMSGTLIVEEKNGEASIDGIYTQTSTYEQANPAANNAIEYDTCRLSTVKTNAKDKTNLSWAEQTDELIESRVQAFDALVKQETPEPNVYELSTPILAAALADETNVRIGSGSAFNDSKNFDITPLMPLVWLAPETGVMTNAASSLRWEASFSDDVKIKLRLSAMDFSDSENPQVVTVACDLVDDGLHTLSAQFQQELPNDGMGIVVYAVRERVQSVNQHSAKIKVVQLSYPKLVAP